MTASTNLLRALLALIIFQLCTLASADAFWDVRITIVGRGVVECETFSGTEQPGPIKVFKKSGKIVLKEGTYVILTRTADDGYRLGRVTDNGESIDAQGTTGSYRFQVYQDHHVAVQFVVDSPTGNFDLAFKEGSSATPIVDPTGTYTGMLPTKNNPYTLDVAMDESGKIDALGTVDGFTNEDGSNEVEGKASLKTKNGTPTASGQASTAGMLNGAPVSGSGKARVPIEVSDGIGGPEVDGVVASGTAKESGVTFTEEKQLVTVPAQPQNIDRNWNLVLTLTETTNGKGKPIVMASGILNMPNGDKTQFKEKRVKYSLKRGYSFNFANGIKLDSVGAPILDSNGRPVIDRKSTIDVSKMLFERAGDVWNPTAGALRYEFLGQKGRGDLLDFL